MKPKFKFEGLFIWQDAMNLAEEINKMIEGFPTKERFNLSSQILRAADSIALNISEGSILQSKKEFQKFLGYSIRSNAEVVSCLHKAKRRKYIDEAEFQSKYKDCFKLMNMMVAFRSKV